MAASLLGQAVFRLTSDIKGFVAGMAGAGAAVKGFTVGLKSASAGMKSMGMAAGMAAMAILAAFAPVILIGAKFERSMSKVKAIMSGSMESMASKTNTVKDMMSSLTAEAQRLGETTRYSASEAAEAMSFLALAGFDTNEILVATAANF